MIVVEDWAEIRRLHKVEKLSKRAIARRLGLHRDTVTRALAESEPPRYQRSPRSSVLEPCSRWRKRQTRIRPYVVWMPA